MPVRVSGKRDLVKKGSVPGEREVPRLRALDGRSVTTRPARETRRNRAIARRRAGLRRSRARIRLEFVGHALRAALLRQIRRILIYE